MYCPLVWHFCSKSSRNKIEKTLYRTLKLITNDYNNDYKLLRNETGNLTMKIKRLRTLVLGIFKTLNNLNPNFMKDTFNFTSYSTHRKHYIFARSPNTSNYGDRTLRAIRPHTWNSLPESFKSITSIIIFKDFVKNWFEPKCKCASR